MATSGTGDVFDLKKIRRLVELMKQHDLSELDLQQGEQRVRLRRGAEGIAQSGAPVSAPAAVAPAPVADSSDDNIVTIN
ncbi:MAG: hypothetical protein N2C12_09625, partial [Planctomycetales bacterium]